jgi:hypothetical protein
VTGSVATDAMSGTMNYALVPKANGNSFVVDVTEQNCTCGGTFSINCKESSHFLNNYSIKHFQIKKSDIFIQAT